MPPALFALVIFRTGSYFMAMQDWTTILLFVLPLVAEMTGMHHCAQLFIE
jgi:hypothetical protein